ncbi:hypothetical protein DesyoDRAFT_1419 [Desulfosporosinus youngiae DSM 17734]|uniref:Uncharacterized protein n=1 Tax=Desulfosporosinus youngiae DSM 17734 TaxID=768710 RepID=H5XTH7_9FIRM|nr:hypothetical protein DesyoDRAFT_1419 [Desulfosporosinus youngiae DSM 17734]
MGPAYEAMTKWVNEQYKNERHWKIPYYTEPTKLHFREST